MHTDVYLKIAKVKYTKNLNKTVSQCLLHTILILITDTSRNLMPVTKFLYCRITQSHQSLQSNTLLWHSNFFLKRIRLFLTTEICLFCPQFINTRIIQAVGGKPCTKSCWIDSLSWSAGYNNEYKNFLLYTTEYSYLLTTFRCPSDIFITSLTVYSIEL